MDRLEMLVRQYNQQPIPFNKFGALLKAEPEMGQTPEVASLMLFYAAAWTCVSLCAHNYTILI